MMPHHFHVNRLESSQLAQQVPANTIFVQNGPSPPQNNTNSAVQGTWSSSRVAQPLGPPQYAFPVRPNLSQQSSHRANGDDCSHLASSEHMLRRKTPSGTLAAGYDGAPLNWSTHPPPLKHVVLPLSSREAQGNVAENRNGLRTPPDMSYRFNVSRIPSYDSGPSSLAYKGRTQGAGFGGSSAAPFAQVDRPHIEHVCRDVPTVLQAPSLSYVGPTASNGPGNYEPYYVHGRFEAYKPAAVRDTAFHPFNSCSGPIFGNSYGEAGQIYDRQWQNSSQGTGSSDWQQKARHTDHAVAGGNTFRSRLNGTHVQAWQGPTGFSLISSPHIENAQFKEKTLGWAHTVYVDLLASIYHKKRNANQSRKPPGVQRSHSQASIYPRPPRQTAFLMRRPSDPAYYGDAAASYNALDYRQSGAPLSSAESRRRQSNSIASVMEEKRSFASRAPPANTGYANSYFMPGHHGMGHGGSPLSLHLNGVPNKGTLKDTARSALEILETLCHESGWRWIDGMLLGGCLAYGLEDFERSLDWYSRIVDIDPSHVEAISNLAATLLSLDRKSEAEQRWLQAVKLRPCYFEAVEHLVGLLCGDHRSVEAVQVIDFVERSLRVRPIGAAEGQSDASSDGYLSSESSVYTSPDHAAFDFDSRRSSFSSVHDDDAIKQPGFGSSGYAIPGSDNGRMLALVHAKGNMLYAQGNTSGASMAFEDAVLIMVGKRARGIHGLIKDIVSVLSRHDTSTGAQQDASCDATGRLKIVLLPPPRALQTAALVFSKHGQLPGSKYLNQAPVKAAANATTSNSLLSLAKIYQDSMTNAAGPSSKRSCGTADILALYYLSLSLQPSPSTANNVGILLAGIQQQAVEAKSTSRTKDSTPELQVPGIPPNSGIALALLYYNYGLNLDDKHAHLYTNLGSLLKDIGQLQAAIKMYERAVECDGHFDIALANLANAVKDQGKIKEAIGYYRRAVETSPNFAEAVCGLANALNSVCDWAGRGGVIFQDSKYDRWHVQDNGKLFDSKLVGTGSGWIHRVVAIVEKQLEDGAAWGQGILRGPNLHILLQELEIADTGNSWSPEKARLMYDWIASWIGKPSEGAKVIQVIERSVKRAMHRWYQDKYIYRRSLPETCYARPHVPNTLSIPGAPTVLPFHTFTCPLSAKEIRQISERNALRISCSTLRAPWLPQSVYPPPRPPSPQLNIGYVSSDFNNHPLAHLMQSVFGMHDRERFSAICYATTASDKSVHRKQIEDEAPVFRDASSWPSESIVQQIIEDGVHILINLNGYTRGAKNEVFAARPVPIQMSFMGFAGTLGAEWCDYLFADQTAVPQKTLRPWRGNVGLEDQQRGHESAGDENWVYSENIIFSRDTFFCCDHRQSSNDAQLPWPEEQQRKWKMRKEIFPDLADDAIILGNFNQLYKIEPTVWRSWLRILSKVPKAYLWLLRFPDLGESNLRKTAVQWAGDEVASRIIFTDVAPKNQHISRARICDLFLDTPECNAHTTAADILWSSTPLLTLPRYEYKMCSRMAASILKGALPKNDEGLQAAKELIAKDEEEYEAFAIRLASGVSYDKFGRGRGRLVELRRLLYENRHSCALFDTRRWVRELEAAYEEAWRRWEDGRGGDIYL